MKITREVIQDLLPLYTAGEASADTRALVELWLCDDPALMAEVQRLKSSDPRTFPDASLPTEVEMRALRRTKRLLALRRWLFGLGIAFTLIGLSFETGPSAGHAHYVHLLMLKDPLYYLSSFVFGLACLATDRVLHDRVATGHRTRDADPS